MKTILIPLALVLTLGACEGMMTDNRQPAGYFPSGSETNPEL